jgi:uncharacterized protein (TIRG00374 family)
MRKMLTNKKFLFTVQILGSFFCIYYVVGKMDFAQIGGTLKGINIYWFFLYIAVSLVSLLLYVFRWQIVNRIIGVETNYKELFKIYLISAFFSNFLPGSLGGDIYRGYVLSKRSNSVSKSLISIFFERGIGLYMMFFIGMCISLFYLDELPMYIFYFFFTVVAIISSGIALALRFKLLEALKKVRFLKIFHPFFDNMIDFIKIVKESKRETFLIIITTIIYQFVQTGITIFLYYAIGITPDFFKMLSLCFLVFILVNIPISINGIGLREALFMQFSFTIGVLPEKNVIISIMIYLANLVVGFIGLAIYIRKKYMNHMNKAVIISNEQ